jgi:peptidoglycan glycosyltransferase
VRLTGLIAVLGLASLSARHGAATRAHAEDSVPQQQTPSLAEVAQAKRIGSTLVASDGNGHSWPLTLDVSLQRTAQRMLAAVRPEAGALVAIEVKTGTIRVMTEWSATSQRTGGLLGQELPAASVFKIVTTAALIEKAHIGLDRKVCTAGGAHRIEVEHLEVPHVGIVECKPFSEALGYSRNAAYAQLASRFLKPEDLDNYADRFGFGSSVPLGLNIPLGSFQSEVEPLAFARTATGFEGSALSPVGAAYLAFVIAEGGRTMPLRLLAANDSDAALASVPFAAIRPETARAIRHMMEITVRRGTCWRAFHDDRGQPYLRHISVAGKTGTLGDRDSVYSWFVGFAPSQKPEVVISVLLKNGPIWHEKANEVGRDWLLAYFGRRQEAASDDDRARNAAH